MDPDYIIVQAGGLGTRLESLTANKPKALTSIDNKPLLFYLFDLFPDKKFIVIGDHKVEALRNYLDIYATVQVIVVDARGNKGTCAGIARSLQFIPEKASFMIMWSDLILPSTFSFPSVVGNYIGISSSLICRWSYVDGVFLEQSTTTNGIVGLFFFKEKSELEEVPQEGEFVRWLQQNEKNYPAFHVDGVKEFGTLASIGSPNESRKQFTTRPFNILTIENGFLVKRGINQQGLALAEYESNWYEFVTEKGFSYIPAINEYSPLRMELVDGKDLCSYTAAYTKKKRIIEQIVSCLEQLHDLGSTSADYFDIYEMYYAKTMKRLDSVRHLLPFSNEREIMINGRLCRNIFFYRDDLRKIINKYRCRQFTVIHGDPTFSNLLWKNDDTPVLIDPRGYFGRSTVYGDPLYDWAKLYYSISGNYDQFNRGFFNLSINLSDVDLAIASNGWEDLSSYYCSFLSETANIQDIKLLHAIIWLSLTTYAWNDYDSICAAFYNGLCLFEEALGTRDL